MRDHGIEAYYQRGWEASLTDWGIALLLKPLFRVMYGVDPFPSAKDGAVNDGTVEEKWCIATDMLRMTADRFKRRKKEGEGALPVNHAFFDLIYEHLRIIEDGMTMDCSNVPNFTVE